MQNLNNSYYINKNKVINIKSEILFREAEDDFYYFNKLSSAYSKLEKAIALTPFHHKSIMLLADICFIKGFYKKSLSLYKELLNITPAVVKVYAGICNCLYVLNQHEESLNYCNKALSMVCNEDYMLYSQLMGIKFDLLLKLKKYEQAYSVYFKSKNDINGFNLKKFYEEDFESIKEKLKIRKKIKISGLKII